MSQDPHQAIPLEDRPIGTGGQQDVPQPTPLPTSQGHSDLSDGSGPLFNMYVKMEEEEDNTKAERWQKDNDSFLIFTGLFSAVMAALVAVSIQDLRPSPQDNSEFYLENIYLLLADPNVSRTSILATPAKPPPFSPPTYAIWVNTFWILSLALSLICGLLETMLQQWVCRHLMVIQQRHNPHKRALIRAFLSNGVDKFHLAEVVEVLPLLLHLSQFSFFLGLLIYLFNIHHTVFIFVALLFGLSGGIYVCIMLMPIFFPDCPYYAPPSSLLLITYKGVSYGIFRILRLITHSRHFSRDTWDRFDRLVKNYGKRLWWGVVKTAQETPLASKAKFDRQVLKETFEALVEDHELEEFFDRIPDFCRSNVVDNPKGILDEMDKDHRQLTAALVQFWDNTLASSLVSETDKKRRLMACVKAADSAGLTNDEGLALRKQAIFAEVIAREPVGERGHHWKALVMDQLGVSEGMLQDYLAHGDSVLLANLIHFTRQYFRSYSSVDPAIIQTLRYILPSISEFHLDNILPELQHEFCALWNEIVQNAQITGDDSTAVYILREIRHIYIALHQGTASAPPTAFSASTHHNRILFEASSYPLCTISGHEAVVGSLAEITDPSAATSPTLPLPDPVLATISPPTGLAPFPRHSAISRDTDRPEWK